MFWGLRVSQPQRNLLTLRQVEAVLQAWRDASPSVGVEHLSCHAPVDTFEYSGIAHGPITECRGNGKPCS